MATQRKSNTASAAPAPEGADQATPSTPPKKRGKLLIVVGAVLVAAAGGGLGFYFMQPGDSAASAVVVPKPPVFLPLELFTVNLASDGAGMQFMQAGVTLKLSEKATAELIKERLPEVRNRMLLVLSAKRSAEILTVPGKQKLALEMSEAVRTVIAPTAPTVASAAGKTEAAPEKTDGKAAPAGAAPAPVSPEIEVLFTSFIIQ